MIQKIKAFKGRSLFNWNILIFSFCILNLFFCIQIFGDKYFMKWGIISMRRQWQALDNIRQQEGTYYGIMVAMWVAGTTIIIFILGKTQDVIYGIKFINIIRWKTSVQMIAFAGICYAMLFPAGLYACIQSNIKGVIQICLLTYVWLIGTGIFIAYYSRKTNVFRMIKNISIKLIQKNCISGHIFNEDSIEAVNKIPLMSMVRNMVFDNLEETQVVKDSIYQICDILEKQKNVPFQYPILMPIISAVCENSGFSTRYEIGRTVEFCAELLEKNWKPDINVWIRAGIILPMIEQTGKNESGKNFVTILKRFPWGERRELVMISLLYVDYLRSCGDDSEQRIKVLMQMDPLSIIREYRMDEVKKRQLYMIWISWHLLNKQDTFQIFLLEHFINDCIQWEKKERVIQSYILSRLEWEEMRR